MYGGFGNGGYGMGNGMGMGYGMGYGMGTNQMMMGAN